MQNYLNVDIQSSFERNIAAGPDRIAQCTRPFEKRTHDPAISLCEKPRPSVLYLQFEMSFQQQQLHRVAFMLLYSDLVGRWDVSFLLEIVAPI